VYFFVKALLARWLIGLVEGIALNRNYFLGAAAFPLCAFSSLTVPSSGAVPLCTRRCKMELVTVDCITERRL
jgi:hypothetical protein